MRALLTFVLAATTSVMLTGANAQESGGRFVMYVGPAPDFRTSLGMAQDEGDQSTISGRMEMGAGCVWTPSEPTTVPTAEVVDVRDPASVGGVEQFGVLYATTYSALVSYRGGTPAVENHTCIRATMTRLATDNARN